MIPVVPMWVIHLAYDITRVLDPVVKMVIIVGLTVVTACVVVQTFRPLFRNRKDD